VAHLPIKPHSPEPAVETHLLGLVDFESCLALQRRLVYETGGRRDGQITVLLCEHPPTISIGRLGSRGHVHVSPGELASRQLAVHWVSRGGGSVLHLPGQLAIYPIVPLEWHGWNVGEYLRRFERALLHTLADCGIVGQSRPDRAGIWGRAGQLAFFGVAVKDWITCHGAFLNVSPAMRLFRWIDTDPVGRTSASSLHAERRQPVRMPTVRASLVQHLAAEFGCERYHLYTGHPLLRAGSQRRSEGSLRAI
jgi:lipoyl(octanoyl) transferase